jgi:hypothetical protein
MMWRESLKCYTYLNKSFIKEVPNWLLRYRHFRNILFETRRNIIKMVPVESVF